MSTTLLIGRWPAAIRRALSQGGDGPIVTFSKARAVKRGHRSRRLDARPRRRRRARRCPDRSAHGGGRQRRAGRGVDLARDAVDAEAVGPVGRDLELEDVGRRSAGRRPAACRPVERVVEDHDPARARCRWRARPRRGSSRRTRRRAAWPSSSLVPSGITAPGRATATVWPGGDVRRAADDLLRLVAVADVDRADAAGGRRRGAARPSSTLPTTKSLERADAVVVDGLDLGAGHRQALARARAA